MERRWRPAWPSSLVILALPRVFPGELGLTCGAVYPRAPGRPLSTSPVLELFVCGDSGSVGINHSRAQIGIAALWCGQGSGTLIIGGTLK